MTGRTDGHYRVDASSTALTLLRLLNLTKLKKKSSWQRESFSSSLVEQRSLFCFSTTESAPASLRKRMMFAPDAVNASTVQSESNVEFKFDPTSLMLWMEQTWLAVPDAFRKSMTNHKASRFLLSHLCAPPKSPRTGMYSLRPRGHCCRNKDFKTGFSCCGSSSSFAVLSLSSRRCWCW